MNDQEISQVAGSSPAMRTIFIGFPWREFVADFIGAFAVFVSTPI